jgi:hypothetical protein
LKAIHDPDDRAEGSRPKKALSEMTKPPPVTQEENGVGDLDSDEEEFDVEDSEDNEGLEDGVAARDEATLESIPARPRGAKLNGGVDDRTDGGRPKKSLPMTTGDLDDYDEELDDGDTEDDGGLEDKVKTVPVLFAGNPPAPPKCQQRCLARRRCLDRPPVEKPRRKLDRAEVLPFFYREQMRGGF